jgi:hypothetical protein
MENSAPAAAPVYRYALDETWLTERGRTLSALILDRMCREAREQVGQVREERAPVADASGQVVFAVRRTEAGQDAAGLMALLAEHCAGHPEFRLARLPVMEVVFRILLANQNRPMSAEEIAQEVEDWVRPGDGRVLNAGVLEKLMLADEYYGIRRRAGAG